MTDKKTLKQRVRQRQEKTGERYTTALAQVRAHAASPGQVESHDVTIIAPLNVPSTVAFHASQMFGRNIFELLKHLVKDGVLQLDPADEITGAMLMTHDGRVLK